MRRFYSRRRYIRKKPRFIWQRETVNNASPNATLNNIDLLSNWRTHSGISINLPDMSIWRIHLKIAITITVTTAATSNDGVLVTAFVDSYDQTAGNQLTLAYDQQDMIYDFAYAYDTIKQSTDNAGVTTVILYKDYDVKSHRKLQALDDTLKLQLAASGTAQITNYSYSVSTLLRLP